MQKALCLLALATFLLFGCGKDSDIFVPDPETPDERVVASVLGLVTDALGEPVSGADVWLETRHLLTNELGLFLFNNVEMSENAYVRVQKPGFFNGSRRFYPVEGNTAQVRIQLLNAATVGSFQSSSGGSIALNGGTTVTFPTDAIMTASGSAYSGQVHVSAVPLYTDDGDMLAQMPGDLVGRNENGQIRALGSFGMIAVELYDDAGNLLQVASGKQATITFAIADDQKATAPSTIPLWYFDEATGYWKEEGEATRNGDVYVMPVGHFSFWNCDAPFELITLTGSVIYTNGEPAQGVFVCITVPGLNTSSGGYTDNEGVFSGKVPKDQAMILTVKDNNGCEVLEFEQNIGPFSDDVTLPPLTITFNDGDLAVATGSLVDCDGEPVEEGIVKLSFGNQTRYLYLDESNVFTYTFFNCDQGPVTVKGFDYANEKESLPVTLDHAATIDFGIISVCEELTEFLIVHADGQDVSFALPRLYTSVQGPLSTYIQGTGIQDSTIYFYANIPGQELGTFGLGGTNGAEVFFDLGFGNWGRINPGTVTFTYFGDSGDFVTGTMEGTYIEVQSGTQNEMSYPFTGEFKILRD